MPLVLARIDDRLIHGQVVVGWGVKLTPNRIILCNDSIAASTWEREIFMSAEATAPYPLSISVLGQDDTLALLNDKSLEKEKVILLVESPYDMLTLIRRGLQINRINVGGMHFKQGKKKIAPFIFVDDSDVTSFKELIKLNIELEGRDVPSSKKIDISQLISS